MLQLRLLRTASSTPALGVGGGGGRKARDGVQNGRRGLSLRFYLSVFSVFSPPQHQSPWPPWSPSPPCSPTTEDSSGTPCGRPERGRTEAGARAKAIWRPRGTQRFGGVEFPNSCGGHSADANGQSIGGRPKQSSPRGRAARYDRRRTWLHTTARRAERWGLGGWWGFLPTFFLSVLFFTRGNLRGTSRGHRERVASARRRDTVSVSAARRVARRRARRECPVGAVGLSYSRSHNATGNPKNSFGFSGKRCFPTSQRQRVRRANAPQTQHRHRSRGRARGTTAAPGQARKRYRMDLLSGASPAAAAVPVAGTAVSFPLTNVFAGSNPLPFSPTAAPAEISAAPRPAGRALISRPALFRGTSNPAPRRGASNKV